MKSDLEREYSKNKDFKCFIGVHKYDVFKEIDVVDGNGLKLAYIVVSRCTNCGKIKENRIRISERTY